MLNCAILFSMDKPKPKRLKRPSDPMQLAKLIGTTQSVIARLESADYEGHSLSMLQRIAEALGQKLELRLSAAA